jgi:nucleoside-diphosphate-sugar epimerase
MSTRISVFGGTGFIGSAFLRGTKHNGQLVSREQRDPPTNTVLYFISTVDNYNVFTDLTLDINTNLITLMETLRHCQREGMCFNFISSWFVYGSHESLPVPETAVCDPRGFYSITKRTAEQLLISWCTTFGVNYRILRLGNIYGPGDNKVSKRKNAIQHMVQEIQDHRPVQLYEGGVVCRDLLYIDDAVRAIDLVLEQGEYNTIYNVGSGEPTLLRDVIDTAVLLTNSRSPIENIHTPAFHQQIQARDFWLDTTKLQALGFKPRVSLAEGLATLFSSKQQP